MQHCATSPFLLACLVLAGCAKPRPAEPVLRAAFDRGEDDLLAWDADAAWSVRDGALACGTGRTTAAVWYRVPVARTLKAEAALTIEERTAPGWAAAGLCVWLDGGNYWRLALVESPDGRRYAELVERRDDTWQAQAEDGIPTTVVEGKDLQWTNSAGYRLALELSADGIEGTIREPATGRLLTRLGYAFQDRPAVRNGRVALHQVAFATRWDDVAVEAAPLAPAADVALAVTRGRAGAAAVLDETALGVNSEATRLWTAILEGLGFGVTLLTPDAAARAGVLSPARFDLLVIPDARPRPVGLAEALHDYLLAGGKALLCGGPAFGRPVWQVDGEWLDGARYAAAIQGVKEARPLCSFDEPRALEPWHASGHDPGSTPTATLAADAREGQALRLDYADYGTWGNAARTLADPFPAGHTLTVLWAKGSPKASEMIVEWREKDDSRWIATVKLTAEWKRYVLAPKDFQYWYDNESVGRGGPGDTLRPENAVVLSVGLATSHCRALPKGRHTIWIDEVATAASPVVRPPAFAARPRIELFCPPYKTYVMRDAARLHTATGLDLPQFAQIQPPAGACSPVTRFMGRGLGRGARLRWIRVIDGADAQGRYRGSPLSLLVHWRAPHYGAVWGYLGTAERRFLAREPVRRLVAETIRQMTRGVFLVEGGTTELVYRRGEPVVAGVRIANFGRDPFRGRAVVELVAPSGGVVASHTAELAVEPGTVRRGSREHHIEPADGPFRVRVHLLEGQRELDRIEHTFQFQPDLSGEPFITVRDGDFWLGDRKWFPVGINYWPRYVAGLEPDQYWSHWLAPSYYDPEVVDEDLARLAALGCTMVSISCSSADEARNLNDFLLRCRRHGLRVNLFVGGFDPLGGGPEPGLQLIETFGVANNPTVFAYDIAWEPRFFGRGERFSWARFDPAWRRWLLDQYGSIEAAEQQWGCPAPREEGEVVTPSLAQLRGRGGHAVMIAAFHRFFYDHVGERYARVIRRIRQTVPKQLVGFRGQACAPPSSRGLWPMHAPGAMKATDFVSPEGYGLMTRGGGRKTPWDDLRRGGLTTVYLRRASGGKPVFWSEFGAVLYGNGTRWRDGLLDLPDERFQFQVAELTDWAKMLVESGANGAAPWWFPGGFRVNEGSDWGLFHPDGTPRPATQALARIARTISKPRPKPNAWLDFDFDAHVFDAWEHYGGEYLALVGKGKVAGVRLDGEGTPSVTCPDLAVGNVPWGGIGPAKHLNAVFEEARVEGGNQLTVVVTNTGVAAWADAKTAAGKPGAVELLLRAGPWEKAVPIPGPVPYLGELTLGPIPLDGLPADVATLCLRLRAAGRGEFGSVVRLSVATPKP